MGLEGYILELCGVGRGRPTSHGELWETMRRAVGELGAWIRDSWMYANGMHTCFYEGWCGKEDVEEALKRIKSSWTRWLLG